MSALTYLATLGLDLPRLRSSVTATPAFWRDLARFRNHPARSMRLGRLYPCLSDRSAEAGSASGHYFFQDIHVARLIHEAAPPRHVDVGSRIDGFISHLLVFRQVEVVDIRPLTSTVPGLRFVQADATELTCFETGSLPSLSCLHAAEHFGLGRYGDPIQPDAHLRLMRALERVLAPGGRLYFSVPCSGDERVEFNAHRVFHPDTIIQAFAGCTLKAFSLVKDDGQLYTDVDPSAAAAERFGCGIFVFEKREA